MCLKENYVHITIVIVYIYIHRYIYIYIFPSSSLSTNHPKSTQTALAKLVAASCSRLYRVTDRSSALWQNTLYYIIIPYSSLSGWWFLTHSRNMSHLNLSSLLYPFVWLKKQYITYWTPQLFFLGIFMEQQWFNRKPSLSAGLGGHIG